MNSIIFMAFLQWLEESATAYNIASLQISNMADPNNRAELITLNQIIKWM